MPCPGSAQPPPGGPPPSHCVAGCTGAGLSCCCFSKLHARLGGSTRLQVISKRLDRGRTICPPKVVAALLVVQPGLPAAAFTPADRCGDLWRRQEGRASNVCQSAWRMEVCVKLRSCWSPEL